MKPFAQELQTQGVFALLRGKSSLFCAKLYTPWKILDPTQFSYHHKITLLFSIIWGRSDQILVREGILKYISRNIRNNKVLLRERKRHTGRRVASGCYADLSPDGGGVPHPVLDSGGCPIQSLWGWGTPQGTPIPIPALILDGVPHPDLG